MRCPTCSKNNRTPKKHCYSCGTLLSSGGAGSPSLPPSRPLDSAPHNFVGEVSGLDKRTEPHFQSGWKKQSRQRTLNVWTFRITCYDVNGYPHTPDIPIEMRGFSFHGNLHDGDRVRIPYAWKAGKVISARTIYNLSSPSTIQASGNDFTHSAAARTSRIVKGALLFIVALIVLRSSNFLPVFLPPFISFCHIVGVGIMVVSILVALSSIISFEGR